MILALKAFSMAIHQLPYKPKVHRNSFMVKGSRIRSNGHASFPYSKSAQWLNNGGDSSSERNHFKPTSVIS